MTKERCPVCGREFTVRKSGKLHLHEKRGFDCLGSFLSPSERSYWARVVAPRNERQRAKRHARATIQSGS